ncbi:MAG: VWA domain-containing protein [Planctomycetota bacterium]
MALEFQQPWFLVLALPLACMLWWWHRRSLSDFSPRQRLLSLCLRGVICLLVLFSLCGLTWLQVSREPFVVFLVDRSASVGAAGERVAMDFLQSAEQFRGRLGALWIPFAARPELPVAGPADIALPLSAEATAGTNLALAVQTAAAAVPAGCVPRIVLLSDGNETEGDVLSAAAAAQVPVWTMSLPGRDEPEVQISEVLVPPEVREGEPFVVEVVVSSNHADEGLVEVFRGGFRVISERRALVAGENRLRFEQTVERDRLAIFRARISGLQSDTLLDNNSAVGLVSASGRPRVLIVESEPERIEELAFALEDEGVAVDVRPVEGIPESLEALQNYELLAFSNVSATKVSPQQMEVIRMWVQEFGGGFLMLGGEQSFGLGGYYRSAIEEVLPVRCDFEKEQEKPSLAMTLVLDRSGSMDGEKLEMARTAARSAVELLGERDQVAVLAFDDQTWVISEMQPAGNRGQISDQISRLQPGGGTSMYPAMELAAEMLNSASARLKHVILLTDGISNSGDFEGLAQRMAGAKVTVSVVALGPEDATDSRLLRSIARIGRGRFYAAPDAAQVPRIFAKETMTAGKSALEEEPFLPQVVRATRALADLDLDSAPLLLGYVVTKPKAGSEVILATEKGDPLLDPKHKRTRVCVRTDRFD